MGQSLDYKVNSGEPVIDIILDNNDFFPGEIIKGNIFLKSFNLLKKGVINYKIFNQEFYSYSNETKKINNKQKKLNNIFEKSIVYNQLIDYSLSTGIEIPFSILLSNDIFPNFEYCLKKVNAYIRTYLQIEIPELILIKQKFFIVKKPFKLLKSPLYFDIIDNFGFFGLLNKGNILFNVSYKKNCYKFFDRIPIDISIINNSNNNVEITKIKIKLLRKIELKDNLEFKDLLFINEIIINKKLDKNNKNLNINTSINLEEPESLFNKYRIEPPDLNCSYISDKSKLIELIPDINSNLIKCEYKIEIFFSYNSFLRKKDDIFFVMPISVCNEQKLSNNDQNPENILIYDKKKKILKHNKGKISLLIKQKENLLNQIEKKEKEDNKKAIKEPNMYTNNGSHCWNTPTNGCLMTKVA